MVAMMRGGAMTTEKLAAAEAAALSLTCTVNVLEAASDGVPETMPEGDKLTPGGRLPLTSDQVRGRDPPEAASVAA